MSHRRAMSLRYFGSLRVLAALLIIGLLQATASARDDKPAADSEVRTRAVKPPPDQSITAPRPPPGILRPLPLPTLTVVTTNMANAFALQGVTWEMKMDRLAALIVASGQVPDIISMTEVSGWTSCTTPASDNSGDYDMIDRLIWRLRDGTGVTFRVAYLVGADGSFGWGRCRYYSGDAVIYNPNRIVNLTPADVATRAQTSYNENLVGFQVRRSLPICARGARTNIAGLEQLIDGPGRVERCNQPTPAGPAWAWQVQIPGGGFGVVATLARFGLVSVPGSSFDVVTTHPTSTHESWQHAPINSFIAGATSPPYRNARPYYPTVVLGDFNTLADTPPAGATSWPAGTTQAFRAPGDVMVVSLGDGTGPLPPLRALKLGLGVALPAETPCQFYPDRSFSDHCGLLVRLTE